MMGEVILKIKKWHVAFFSCLASSILAHGFLISNCFYMNSDDASYVYAGSSIIVASGRYIGRFIENFIEKYGFLNVIKPFNLMMTVFLICIICVLIVEILDIKNIKYVLLFGMLFPLQPCIIDILGFNFVCHFDAMAALLIVFSIYLMIKKNNYILPIPMIVVSLGIYQAYIPMAIVIIYMYIFKRLFENNDIKKIIIDSFKILIVFIVGVILYVIGNRLTLNYYHIEMGYWNAFGKNVLSDIGVMGYVNRVLSTYDHFLKIFFDKYGYMSEFGVFGILMFIYFIIFHIIFGFYIFKRRKNYAKINIILLVVAILIEPIIFDFHFVMAGYNVPRIQTSIYFIVLMPMIFMDVMDSDLGYKIIFYLKKYIIECIAILFIWCFIFLSVGEHYTLYIVNRDYERTFNYIANKIYNHPDFTEDINIVTMGHYRDIKNHASIADKTNFLIHANLYPSFTTFSDTWAVVQHYKKEASLRVDYLLDPKEYDKYKDMPCFPSDGCIRKISDNALLVKFGEN